MQFKVLCNKLWENMARSNLLQNEKIKNQKFDLICVIKIEKFGIDTIF